MPVVFVAVCFIVSACVIAISVSATDGPNTQFCYSLVSRPRLIARQEQQQEAARVLLCFHAFASVCVSVCVCLRGPSSTSQAVGRTPRSLGHMPDSDDASCLKWLWRCLCFARVCRAAQLCVYADVFMFLCRFCDEHVTLMSRSCVKRLPTPHRLPFLNLHLSVSTTVVVFRSFSYEKQRKKKIQVKLLHSDVYFSKTVVLE